MAAVANGVNVSVQRQVSQSAGPRNAAPVLRSVPVQPPAPGSQQWRGDASNIVSAHISVVQAGGCGGTIVDLLENEPRLDALKQHLATLLAVPPSSAAAEIKVLFDSGSGITAISEESVEALWKKPREVQAALTLAIVGLARVMTSSGKECAVEMQSCPLNKAIETPRENVRFTVLFIVLPG